MKPLSRTQRQLQDQATLHAVNAVKMASILVLRNNGYGAQRLKKFSDEFNTVIENVNQGWHTLTDICDVIYDETGLDMQTLRVEGHIDDSKKVVREAR